MMDPVRTFLALPVPAHVREILANLSQPIRDPADRISWVKAENIHITLNFLGDTDPELIESQAEIFEALAAQTPVFRLGTTETGIFPHANNPRVLWVGSAPFDTSLAHFKKNLDREVRELGYGLDNRPFQPHITVARVKTLSRKSSFIHHFLAADVRELIFDVDGMNWVQSTLTPAGAEYEILKTFKFNRGGHE